MESSHSHRIRLGAALAGLALAGSVLGGCANSDDRMAAQLAAAEAAAKRAEDAAQRAEKLAHVQHATQNPAPAPEEAVDADQSANTDPKSAIEPTPAAASPGFDLAPAVPQGGYAR